MRKMMSLLVLNSPAGLKLQIPNYREMETLFTARRPQFCQTSIMYILQGQTMLDFSKSLSGGSNLKLILRGRVP